MELSQSQIDALITICEAAGEEIMEVYENANFDEIVDFKADDSPLTIADTKSHDIIEARLPEVLDIPILSEEGRNIPFSERKDWESLWLVDPLDGTKEFIKKNGEFTINIALIHQNRSVAGFIYAPAKKLAYFAANGESWKILNGNKTPIQAKSDILPKVAASSRSHSAPEEDALYERLGIEQNVSMGSAFKFILVAEGDADIYYRHNPTMEWDTAAGQAVVEAAGGKVIKLDGSHLEYNRQNLVNSSFIAYAGFDLPDLG